MDVWSAMFLRTEEGARTYLESKLWPDGPICPRCGTTGKGVGKLRDRTTRPGLLKCYRCRQPFAVTIGTVFEASHVPLHHWFRVTCLLAAPSLDDLSELDLREALRAPRRRCTVSDLQAILGVAGATMGGTSRALPTPRSIAAPMEDAIELAVCGAHLSGQPLNRELADRGARLVRTARTAPGYSFYALTQGSIAKPGLVFDGVGQGGIEVEIWSLSPSSFGTFVAAIPSPLSIGTIALEDGSLVKGFLCEAHAIVGAENITAYRGWRTFLKAKRPPAG
jgi:hypothetical protein